MGQTLRKFKKKG